MITSVTETDLLNATFCDRECFVEFLKDRMTENGLIKLSEEEIQQAEEETEKEIKSMKKSILKDLEDSLPIGGGAHNAKFK